MHRLTTELIEKMADRLQTGKSAPRHTVTVWRQNKERSFETMPFILPEITRITIDRRWNMAADELQVEMANAGGYYSPDYSPAKAYTGVGELPRSGYKDVLRAYNRIECSLGYGDSLVRMFTGQIQNIDIAENPPAVRLDALNAYRKLLKPIDPVDYRELVYTDETAFNIIRDLCSRAGVDNLVYDNDTVDGMDYAINKVSLPLGTSYSDAMKEILGAMNHRVTGGRYGELQVVKNINYTQQDFHNWEFDDYVNLTEGVYKYDSSVLRNRVVIMSDIGWQAFEDPFLVDYCNGEIISSGLEAPWAATLEQKWAVADHYFLSMRRKMRRISVAVCGNPAMDVGDLVKLRMLTSSANGKYMIIAIQSNYTEKGYIDQIDLEYVAGAGGHLCEPAAGEYAAVGSGTGETGSEDSAYSYVSMSLRDEIVDFALSYLGILYQWGGGYPDYGYGVDCSNYTYRVLRHFGLMDGYMGARAQKNWCKMITRDELLPGDLVFYDGSDGLIGHVVMYIGHGQIIGANGGDSKTTTKGIAESKNARVKIQAIDYNPRRAHYGRPPKLV